MMIKLIFSVMFWSWLIDTNHNYTMHITFLTIREEGNIFFVILNSDFSIFPSLTSFIGAI